MTRHLALTIALLVLPGCAAVFKGSRQDVAVDAIPANADVRVDGRYAGPTPVIAELDRNTAQTVVVSKDGYADEHVRVERHPDAGWWVWDIGTCAIPVMLCVPLLVDALSGAWFSLDDDVYVKLRPLAPPVAAPVPPPAPSSGY